MPKRISRREWLGVSAAAGLSMVGGGRLLADAPSESSTSRVVGPGFRFVHLSDIHVQPELRGAEGLTAALKAVNQLRPQPDFILTGGDLVMDCLHRDAQRSRIQFELLKKIFDDHAGLPVHHCIGNHDCFGWGKKRKTLLEHPQYGKRMVQDILQLERTYYRFDHKGWRFFVLDNILPHAKRPYAAGLGETQREWFAKELQMKPAAMPAIVVAHIPILTTTVMFEKPLGDNQFLVRKTRICGDALELASLFEKHNIRLSLSGHTHQHDRVEFRGVTYICDGAVSGDKWRGPRHGCQEGFGVLDVTAQSTVRNAYHDYGWTT